MSLRTYHRALTGYNPIALPSSSKPQFVNEDGFEYDPSDPSAELEGSQPVEVEEDGAEEVDEVDEEIQVDEDEDVDMEDGEVEDEDEAVEEVDPEQEDAPEPLLSIAESLVLPYSLTQTRYHHLTSLFPHVFTHPLVPSNSRPRARPPPKGVFQFPTPPPSAPPLPAPEYHGPYKAAETTPGPSAAGHEQQDTPSSTPSGKTPKLLKPKKGVNTGETGAPPHEIECISRCTLTVGPTAFPGVEIWVGRFVDPQSKIPKRERARPGEREKKRKSLAEETAARRARRAAEPKAKTPREPTSRPHARASLPGSATSGHPGLDPPAVTATYSASQPYRPPPSAAAPTPVRPRPTSVPGAAPPARPTASPQLIQLVNQAASRAPWLSTLIYKAAGSTASQEELERLGKAVARLSRGEPIADLAPPGAVGASAPSGPSTMAQARPPASVAAPIRPAPPTSTVALAGPHTQNVRPPGSTIPVRPPAPSAQAIRPPPPVSTGTTNTPGHTPAPVTAGPSKPVSPTSSSSTLSPAPSPSPSSAPVPRVQSSAPAPENKTEDDSDAEVDMSGPKQVGGGPLLSDTHQIVAPTAPTPTDVPPAETSVNESVAPDHVTSSVSTSDGGKQVPQSPDVSVSLVAAGPSQAQGPDQPAPRPELQPQSQPHTQPQAHPVSQPSPHQPPVNAQQALTSRSVAAPHSQPQYGASVPTETAIVPSASQSPYQPQTQMPTSLPAQPSPLARPPSATPPPAPAPVHPLPPPFLIISFKEQPTEKFLIPLGKASFISRVGGDHVTSPPPVLVKPEPEATAEIPTPSAQVATHAPLSTFVPSPAAASTPVQPTLPASETKPLRNRTRQSLGRGAKEPPQIVRTPTPAVEPQPVSQVKEEQEPPVKTLPTSGLPLLPGMAPTPGTILISTVIPSGESRWGKVDWEKLGKRLPFGNPELWHEVETTPKVKEEPKDTLPPADQVSTDPKTPARGLRHRAVSADEKPKPTSPARPSILNLAAERFLPPSGAVHALTIRLTEVNDAAWKRIRDVVREVEDAEIEVMVKDEPGLLGGMEVDVETSDLHPSNQSPLSTLPVQSASQVNENTAVPAPNATVPSEARPNPENHNSGNVFSQPGVTSTPAREAVPNKPGLSEKIISALRPLYITRKKSYLTHLLTRAPARSFLRTRLPPPPPPELVDATTDKWAPRPYPISTKPLYASNADEGEGEDQGGQEIELTPEPPKGKKRKLEEETVTFEMPVSLDSLDERVEQGAKRGIGRRGRGRGGRLSYHRVSAAGDDETAEDGKKRKGKRGTLKGICEGCAREGIKVWRRGPGGRGTLCNACGDLFVADKLGELKAPGAMKAFLGEAEGEQVVEGGDRRADEEVGPDDGEKSEPLNQTSHDQVTTNEPGGITTDTDTAARTIEQGTSPKKPPALEVAKEGEKVQGRSDEKLTTSPVVEPLDTTAPAAEPHPTAVEHEGSSKDELQMEGRAFGGETINTESRENTNASR